jgi:glycolate oxidase iron-sulfur subunit
MMAAPTPVGLNLFSGPDAPKEEDLYKCVHCGFCLQACPTYVETGLETESPRGRIALMKAVNEERIGITPTVFRHWDLCIQCRACEVACPSGVPYGRLIEATKAQVERYRRPRLLPRLAASVLLKRVLPSQRSLTALIAGLRLYQRSGLRRLVRWSRVLRLVSARLASLEASAPEVPRSRFKAAGQVVSAAGERRARVALLSGCVMPLIHGPEMHAVTRVLARNGCEVVVPKAQVCCGAINSHSGDLDTARELARRNVDVFLQAGVDAVVVASAGCGIRMKEYGDLLEDDPEYAGKAERLSTQVKDIHEFLVGLPFVPPAGRLDHRVTLQDSCHLAHAQRITEAPRALLHSIPGVEVVEMANSSRCCGAGGTYTITQRDFSLRLLDNKMNAVEDTAADVLATANPGCHMQLRQGIQRAGLSMEVRYVTDLLDESYAAE